MCLSVNMCVSTVRHAIVYYLHTVDCATVCCKNGVIFFVRILLEMTCPHPAHTWLWFKSVFSAN